MVQTQEVLSRQQQGKNGQELEHLSDLIDEVNVIKGKSAQEIQFDQESQFDAAKDKDGFRQYEAACDRVKNFYAEQHAKQTLAYNLEARARFNATVRARMSVWEAIEKLNTLIDESDPDTEVSQIEHLLQTAEAIRRDGKPEWMQVTGLIHDLGKLLYFYGVEGEGQWSTVGDTFIVGAAFSDKNIYPETFKANPDYNDPKLNTELGIYEHGCGLDNVMISWGHDEYLYHVMKHQSSLPKEALSMIRYHSFYPWHRGGAYTQFMNEDDYEQLKAVKAFNPYDLYSKSDEPPKVEDLKPYYQGLIAKFFNPVIEW
ncbi:hypothetical protein QFC19_008693 [Naganishia cerealis]|uniref:Uncharacterized protein n=1 Tax=Naganishia cerealis TaxID=610337 RepID=A0ACC2V0D6_9TREE|nr:hypothetical protein QFC19_008693 [Naganishia cerealis]